MGLGARSGGDRAVADDLPQPFIQLDKGGAGDDCGDRPCCMEPLQGVLEHRGGFDHAIRENCARPSWFIRLRDLMAIATSVARRVSWRDFRVSPMTRL